MSDGVAKGYLSGTHRLVSPEETLARVAPFLDRLGITRVANVTGLDAVGLPVVTVCRPASRSISVSQGKGLTLAAAKASGIMESLEMHHAERVPGPLLLGSFNELSERYPLADVDGLVPARRSRYHPDFPLLWIEGRCLLKDETRWVPYEAVHTNALVPEPTGSGCFSCTSNGLASGNHPLEAVLHGLYEVIERDATTLWRLKPPEEIRATRIDPGTVRDPNCAHALELFERAGLAALIWETTSNVGLPAFLCTLFERTRDPDRAIYTSNGMGCHTARDVALLRALTEAAQSRLTLIAGSRDDVFRRVYLPPEPDEFLGLHDTLREPAPRSFCDSPSVERETFEEDLANVLERLRSVGIRQAVHVDLTRPEYEIPVARVVVPGLEGCDETADYVPGARAKGVIESAGGAA